MSAQTYRRNNSLGPTPKVSVRAFVLSSEPAADGPLHPLVSLSAPIGTLKEASGKDHEGDLMIQTWPAPRWRCKHVLVGSVSRAWNASHCRIKDI